MRYLIITRFCICNYDIICLNKTKANDLDTIVQFNKCTGFHIVFGKWYSYISTLNVSDININGKEYE